MPTLKALQNDIHPAIYVIEGELCTLGRAEMCHLVIPRHVISRIHATVQRDGPRYVLQDANSANGTFVNGRRIHSPHLLTDQDVIGLSAPAPMFLFTDADATTRLASQFRHDPQLMQFFLNNQPVDLTAQEFRLLYHLYQHAGTVCDRAGCTEATWDEGYNPVVDDDRLDKKVSNLRRKLAQLGPEGKGLIETRAGFGYILIF